MIVTTKQFISFPLLAAMFVVGFVGCDSGPSTPSDPSPTAPKVEAPTAKNAPKSIKEKARGNPAP